jgi:hypothetical protein
MLINLIKYPWVVRYNLVHVSIFALARKLQESANDK